MQVSTKEKQKSQNVVRLKKQRKQGFLRGALLSLTLTAKAFCYYNATLIMLSLVGLFNSYNIIPFIPLIVTGSVSFSTTIIVRGEQINQLDFAGYEHDPSLPNL